MKGDISNMRKNTQYDAIIMEAGAKYNVDPILIKIVMAHESAFNPNAKSPVGAYGLMQLMSGTAKDLGVNGNNVRENIMGGAKYLRQILDKPWINGNIPRALAGYNAGPYAKWLKAGKNPPTQETREYMDAIPKIYNALKAAK